MADGTQRKIADRDNVNADDPFAELTKIMGFDPRVPVKRSEAEALRSLSSPAADDFEIDLEKEMLGEFALDDQSSGGQLAPPAEALASVQEVGADDVEAGDLVEFDAADFEAVSEFADAGDEHEVRNEDEIAEPVDFTSTPDVAFDAAVAETMDEELFEAEEPIVTAVAGEEPTRAAAADADIDATFDDAMAEVDMDFRSRPDFVRPTAYEVEDEQPVVAAKEVADPVNAGELDAGFEDELNALLGNGGQASAVVPAPVTDELNDIDFDLKGDETEAAAEAEDLHLADFDLAFEAEASATASDEVTREEVAFDELDWKLDTQVAAAAPAFEVAGEASSEEADEAASDLDYEEPEARYQAAPEGVASSWDDDPMPLAAAPEAGQSEDEIAFDEAAFAETLVDDLDDPQREDDAVRHEYEQPPVAPVTASAQPEVSDPFEALRRMASPYTSRANFTARDVAPVASASASGPVSVAAAVPLAATPAYVEDEFVEEQAAFAAEDNVPDIETIDVPESAVALADDLDLPELEFEEELPQPTVYDELDAEFSSLLNQMNAKDIAPAQAAAPVRDTWHDREPAPAAVGNYAYASGTAAGATAYASTARPAAYATENRSPVSADDIEIDEFDLNLDDQSFDESFEAAMAEDYQDALPDVPDYDPDFDEEMAVPGVPPVAQQPSRRGFWIAALVGGVAVAGGVGAFALSFGDGGGSSTPALVKADQSPIKVRPENPGGTVVPNQDNKVYESVAGAKNGDGPRQEKLVTTAEEPVDVKTSDDAEAILPSMVDNEAITDSAPSAKGEDRIEQVIDETASADAPEIAAVQPRKVRTMVVRPDGSLVPAEAPAAEAAANPAEVGVATETTGAVPTAKPAPAAEAKAAQPKPPEQPAEAKLEQVAAVDTTATAAAPAGAWSMQIASQPSEAAAQSTYQDLARRYGGVLNGRGVNIVKAEIAGKGTFWRVRVPAESRTAAVNLCNDYKSAGGTCFVSK